VSRRFDDEAFAAGAHHSLHRWLGAVPEADGGFRFRVWAPRAKAVRVTGEVSEQGKALRRGRAGVWSGRIPSASAGQTYHLELTTPRGSTRQRLDPFARHLPDPSGFEATLVDSRFRWRDGNWMRRRATRQGLDRQISIYEAHLGSWQRGPNGEHLGYRDVGRRLAEYATEYGFTHVELMPVAEHPFYGSWGYQATAYFAATSRYGSPDDFKALVDTLHRAGVGVILDWVPSHFATDDHALARFDGYPLFEHRDPRKGFHPDWQSFIFDYGRGEVRSFLISNAAYWLDEFHIDGLRVDAVASMLYLDFSRPAGQWLPNRHGGNEHIEAYQFLRSINDFVDAEFPDVLMVAEESSAWPGVTRTTELGGVGFDLKWDMGWMNDTLEHFRRPPDKRPDAHASLTFRMMYGFNERFVLALSHDEVVHEKASLAGKMPGPDHERFANLRVLFGYQWALPGKQLVFMGGEFAQWAEWDHDGELEWDLLQWVPHKGMRRWVRDLNRLQAVQGALHRHDFDPTGFAWIDPNDHRRSVVSFLRFGDEGDPPVAFLANLSTARHRRYRVGVPVPGRWKTLLTSDAAAYGGRGRSPGTLVTDARKAEDHDQSLVVDLPPLTALFLGPAARSK